MSNNGDWCRIVPKEDHVKLVEKYVNGATLQVLAEPYGVSRERIRQIIQRLLPVQAGTIKITQKKLREAREEAEYRAIYYRKCKCGNEFFYGWLHRRRKHQQVDHLCNRCYLKIRPLLEGYRAQRRWGREHKEEVRARNRKYHAEHREELNRKQRERRLKNLDYWKKRENKAQKIYYKRHRAHILEWQKQRKIRISLGEWRNSVADGKHNPIDKKNPNG